MYFDADEQYYSFCPEVGDISSVDVQAKPNEIQLFILKRYTIF